MKRIRYFLFLGLIGSVITVIGELTQGLAPTLPAPDMLTELFLTYAALPIWRIGVGSTVGAMGILLQFFGVYGLYLAMNNPKSLGARFYHLGCYNYAFVGALIHILLSISFLIYKLDSIFLMDYLIWFTAPILVLFFAGYIPFSVILFWKIFKGETIFPKWCCLLNPLVGKGLFNLVRSLIANDILANGFGNANMGLTAVVMFALFLITMPKPSAETPSDSQ
jgi:hypothetical protein